MKIVFMGTPLPAVAALDRLRQDGHKIVAVYTQPDRPAGRGNRVALSPVKEFAAKNGLPVFQPVKIRTPEALAEFQSHRADVAVVVAYGRILPETFLNVFPKGAINVHFSLLPKYRGASPVNWAIVNGETETGVTTMRMDAGLDTGAILLQRPTNIRDDENAIELMDRLSVIGAEVLSDTITDLERIVPTEQLHKNATYAPIMKRGDGLIDWHMRANALVNRIRGFQPFPTSFTFHSGQRLTLWKVHLSEFAVTAKAKPGEILYAADSELVLSCGDGTILSIDELQPEGRRRMGTRDFLNGSKIKIGDVFGA